MNILDYLELSPRIRGKKFFMLVKSHYESMLTADSLLTALRRLEGTVYQPFIAKHLTEEPDLGEIEKSLTEAYQDMADFILHKLKNRAAIEVFKAVNRSLELKSLASILKSVILQIEWDKAIRYLIPFGKIGISEYKALIEGESIVNILQHFNLQEKLLTQEIERIMRETDDPLKQAFEVEITINKYAYGRIRAKSRFLSIEDAQGVRVLGVDMDIMAIMTILRLKKLQFRPEEIEKLLVPAYYHLSEDEVKKALTASTEKDAIKIFTGGRYVNVVSPLVNVYEVKEDLSIIETALRRYHPSVCYSAFYSIFNVGEALSYLYLRWYELRDIIAILVGKHFNLPSKTIEESLILHQPPYPI